MNDVIVDEKNMFIPANKGQPKQPISSLILNGVLGLCLLYYLAIVLFKAF